MSCTQLLPSILDTAEARPLAVLLRERLRDEDSLILDGSNVTELGQACLQLLLSAQASAQARGKVFTVVEPSQPFLSLVTIAGAAHLCSETLA